MKFVLSGDQADAEREVWDRLRSAFGTDDDEPIFHEIEDINWQVVWSDTSLTFPAPHPEDLEREMDDGAQATTIDQFAD